MSTLFSQDELNVLFGGRNDGELEESDDRGLSSVLDEDDTPTMELTRPVQFTVTDNKRFIIFNGRLYQEVRDAVV